MYDYPEFGEIYSYDTKMYLKLCNLIQTICIWTQKGINTDSEPSFVLAE